MEGAESGSSKMNIKGKWKRLASPRELFYGIRPDGTIITSCVHIQINCQKQITKEQFEACVHHFNKNITCFREYLTEGKDNEFWIAKENQSTCSIEEGKNPELNYTSVLQNIINIRHSAESVPSWQFHYVYKGKFELPHGDQITKKYSHLYQLIFSFHTGTLDEYSCAIICNMFLNNLDCILKNVEMQSFLDLDIYENLLLNTEILVEKRHLLENASKLNALIPFQAIFFNSVANFSIFSSQKTDTPLCKTESLILSKSCTKVLFEICFDLNISVYCTLISNFSYVLLKKAQEAGFTGNSFDMKILHNINSKWIYGDDDEIYKHQVGLHMHPNFHMIKMKADGGEIFDDAKLYEDYLNFLLSDSLWMNMEILRHIIIDNMERNYKSKSWNPFYFFSVGNLGDLDTIFTEHSNNSFYTSRYDRSKTVQDTCFMDIVFYVFKGQLNFCIDYSTQYISDSEIKDILRLFKKVILGAIDA